jgi:digeranylgeranylglycerophospholipid reductase
LVECDLLVVGGGPAGLALAETAARAGTDVLVLERQPEIGEPVHTSGATAVATVRRFGIPRSLYHPITRIRFVGPNEQAVFEYMEPPLCVIDVRGTYRHLAERARSAGARVMTGARAMSPLLEHGAVVGCKVVSGGDEAEMRARIVADASGYRATIARQAGLHDGFTRFGVGAEYELLARECREDEVVLVVGSRHAPSGYAWIFPWGEGRVRVGVGVHHADVRVNPKEPLDRFVREAGSLGVPLEGAETVEYHFGLVPSDDLPPRLVGDGVLAVGDAACQATLVVGEGIRVSMVAGRIAGTVAALALEAGRTDQAALVPYDREFRRCFERKLRFGRLVNARLASFDDDKWDEKVRLLRKLPPKLVPPLLQAEIPPRALSWLLTAPSLWRPALELAAGVARRR